MPTVWSTHVLLVIMFLVRVVRHLELLRTVEAIAYSWELHACIMWLSRHFDIVALKFIVFVH